MIDKLINKVKKLENQFKQISDNLVDAIYIMDAKKMTFDYITPTFSKVSGYSPDEFLNIKLDDLITAESQKKINKILNEEIKNVKIGKQKLRKEQLEFIKN